jgi:hypothetical protein
MFEFAAQNNFTHKHMPFGHFYMTKTKKFEIGFLQKHYSYPKKPFSTDQHIMFVNAVEDYRLGEHERYGIMGCGVFKQGVQN